MSSVCSCPECGDLVDEDADTCDYGFASHQCIHCGFAFEFGEGVDHRDDEEDEEFEMAHEWQAMRDRLSAYIDSGASPEHIEAAANYISEGERNREAWMEIADFLEEQGA